MFKEMLENVQKKTPLIHNITNYVTVNDCANILLACGGSPIMSDDMGEVEEITSICGGLNINIGTLNANTIPSMFKAGTKANELQHPVLLDPVGAGASALRTNTALELLEKVKFTVIRGNISEILPRITVNLTSSRSFNAVFVLSADAPAPTGSRTAGWLRLFAFLPAANIDGIVLELSVPIFILSPPQIEVISSASPISSDIMGEPPHASKILAQSFTVT